MDKWHGRGLIALGVFCWLAATGLAVEKTIRDIYLGLGVPSWTMLLAIPALTLVVALLLHQSMTDLSRNGRYVRGIAAGFCGVLALMITLPYSIGTSGSIKDMAIRSAEKSAEDIARAKGDYDRTNKLVDQAQKWAARECVVRGSDGCKEANFVLTQRQASLEKLRSTIEGKGPVQEASSSEKRIAWALGLFGLRVETEDIQLGWPMLPPIAFELLSAACFCFGWSKLSHATPEAKTVVQEAPVRKEDVQELTAVEPEVKSARPPRRLTSETPAPAALEDLTELQARRERIVQWVADYIAENNEPPSFAKVRAAFKLSDATAHRFRREGIERAQRTAA